MAGIDVVHIRFGSAINTWHEIVEEAMYLGCVEELVAVVQGEYAESKELQRTLEHRKRSRSPARMFGTAFA